MTERARTELSGIVTGATGRDVAMMAAVGGGSISSAYWCRLVDGGELFLKVAPPHAPRGMFAQEELSLGRMAATRTVRVPGVVARGDDWLILEWLEPAAERRGGWKELGRQLARMHRHANEQYGWDSDNFIGSLPQVNDPERDWPGFWRERRLRPQLERAADRLDARTLSDFERLMDGMDERLGDASADGPSLLHGDLWSGNVQFTAGGAVLFDPACSYGHREVDLAMAALFGGFPPEFSSAYEAEWPLLRGAAARRPIYQLYFLLVHVNLFGGAYVEQTRRVMGALV